MMASKIRTALGCALVGTFWLLASGGANCAPGVNPLEVNGDGLIAPDIMAPLGDPVPYATAEQLATFQRGKAVLKQRFDLADGLGPEFNVTSCGACHEKPVAGGGAALYRNFFLNSTQTEDDAVILTVGLPAIRAGVLRLFSYASVLGIPGKEADPARPNVLVQPTFAAQRKAIPMFGVGLIAELSDEAILANADPDDADGDGVSGRHNEDQGFVGRFGRKCQTVSIEGFIRGPLFNHLGLTTEPLSNEQRALLPVDSSIKEDEDGDRSKMDDKLESLHQVAAPAGPTTDDDLVADPEFSKENLFDLVSFSMLLAAPQFDAPTAQTEHGRELFHTVGCSKCHVPRLEGPRGPLPLYSDLLLHDMGPELADNIKMGLAAGNEFRTQPLWGIVATGPFLHDGRAETLEQAILAHGGEGQSARDAFAALSAGDQTDLVEFLKSLGGRSQASPGLLPPGEPVPATGDFGGPFRDLTQEESARFIAGRAAFDKDFGYASGVGGMTGADDDPRFNGDSCRACHTDPVFGGAGARDVNVMRHGHVSEDDGTFTAPSTTLNTILHKEVVIGFTPPQETDDCNVFEHRQTPHLFGLGLIDAITEATILANADPDDDDSDGISGRGHILPGDGRLGRFGWKAQVPSVAEFVRDGNQAELGITVPAQPGLTFGFTTDGDDVPDPEVDLAHIEDMAFFLSMLAGPPRQLPTGAAELAVVEAGEALFNSDALGCAKCHIPELPATIDGAGVNVPLFSDLLLHEILPAGQKGIEDGDAGQREFRTAPLWGLSQTAPYFHSGEADTIEQAILLHAGEGEASRDAFEALSADDKAAVLAFLDSL